MYTVHVVVLQTFMDQPRFKRIEGQFGWFALMVSLNALIFNLQVQYTRYM